MNDWTESVTRLLGKQVVVTLEYGTNGMPSTVARGQLLSASEDGQIVVRDEMGFVHYCWPMLHIEADEVEVLPTLDEVMDEFKKPENPS